MTVQGEVVRAFQHGAEPLDVLFYKDPMLEIGGIIEQVIATGRPLGGDHDAEAFAMPENLGVAEVGGHGAFGLEGGGHHRIVFGFDEVEAIVALGKALLLILKAILARFHAGIEKIEHIAVGNGVTGETAGLIIGLIGRQSNAVPVPVKQILGGPVPPVHGGPFGRVGVELAEKMVFAMIEAKAVGIVDPSGLHRKMDSGTPGSVAICPIRRGSITHCVISDLLQKRLRHMSP